MTSILPERSPCRRHPCSVEHADLVTTYRLARLSWEEEAELATMGHETEMREYRRDHPGPTFKLFLLHTRRIRS